MKDLKQELEALSTSLNELQEAMNLSLNLISGRIENALKEADAAPEEQKSTVKIVPFDIEKAKQGAKIVTKDGCSVRILCYDFKDDEQPIVAEIYKEGESLLETYSKDGSYMPDDQRSDYDLMIIEEELLCVGELDMVY